MGNSKKVWKSKYDVNYHGREAQAAVDAMATWRASLLAKAANPPVGNKRVLEDSDESEGSVGS